MAPVGGFNRSDRRRIQDQAADMEECRPRYDACSCGIMTLLACKDRAGSMWAPSFACQQCLEDQERCLPCTVQLKRNYNTELAVLRRLVRGQG